MQPHLTLHAQLLVSTVNVARADWQTASLIHPRQKQAAVSIILMMSKEGKELVISQVFPLGAQSEGMEVNKTQSLLHLNFNLKRGSFSPEKGSVKGSARNNLQSQSVVPRLDNLGMFLEYSNVFLIHLIPLTRVI